MKKVLLSILFVALTVLSIAQNVRTNPDEADFYIKGYITHEKGADGQIIHKLSQVESKGIYFNNPSSIRLGEETDREDIKFQFSHARTDYSGGIETPLDFWKWDPEINEWQPDSETRQGTADIETKKSMVIMLVLDCSSSMNKDFAEMKESAINLIKIFLDASNGVGNVKMGIVGFSTIQNTELLGIQPLTNSSFNTMSNFINRLETGKGTALYYAMDRSVELMERYCQNEINSKEPLSTAVMVTFTDGLDQVSRDLDKDLLSAEDYYNYLSKKIKNKTINSIKLRKIEAAVRGNDIETDAQLAKFQRIGESLNDEFKLLDNFSELDEYFESIAKGLINEFQVLNCYVPNSLPAGKVAWTYPGKKKKEVVRTSTDKKWFFGLNLGAGFALHSCYKDDGYFYDKHVLFSGIPITIGIDAGFPVSPKLNIGVYLSAGYEVIWSDVPIAVGPLFLINLKKGSIYTGAGFHAEPMCRNYGGDIRFGYEFNSGIYIFYEQVLAGGGENYQIVRMVGGGVSQYWIHNDFGSKFMFHIGYNFLNKKSKK